MPLHDALLKARGLNAGVSVGRRTICFDGKEIVLE